MKIIRVSKIKKKNFHSIEDIKLNYSHIFKIRITRKLHNDFSFLSGDKSPIHSNLNFCKRNGYKNIVGYAFLITCILSKIYGMYFPGGTELCLKQTCNFKRPFFIKDTLKIFIKVIQKNISAKLITVSVVIKNQNKKVIFDGETIFQLKLNEIK
tara:strand:- start:241 stop:702 length:462 start_codon:yes stop_codon:yes gene_type:complete